MSPWSHPGAGPRSLAHVAPRPPRPSWFTWAADVPIPKIVGFNRATAANGAPSRLGTGAGLKALLKGPGLVAVLGFFAVLTVAVVTLSASQASTRTLIVLRYRDKVGSGSALIATYVAQVAADERLVVAHGLNGPHPSATDLEQSAQALGTPAAFLLDAQGKLVQAYPPDPALMANDLATRYAYLGGALSGHVSVSDVVASAVKANPIVAVAVPISTRAGRGVFSAGFDIRDGPLTAYLESAFPHPTTAVYLVDESGKVIANTGAHWALTLKTVNAALASIVAVHPYGYYESPREGEAFYAVAAVPGTPWHLVATLPTRSMYASVRDSWVSWCLLACLAFAGTVALVMLGRVIAGRDEVAAALAKRKELDSQKSDFVSSVSHDLRTPLTSIIGYVDLLTEPGAEPLSDDQRTMMGNIDRNAKRLASLIDDLLRVSRLEAGQFSMTFVPVRLQEITAAVIATMRPIAADRRINLELCQPDAPVVVAADREQLERAVVNLVTNAIKFTPSGGRVELTLTTDGTEASIVVTDTGCGIPEVETPRVFERFFRSSAPENQVVPGTGLGLAITKAIIDQHGGSIELRSSVGAGTTVTATLPVVPTDQAIPDFSDALQEARQGM